MNIALQSQQFLNIEDFFRTLQACLTARYGQDRLRFTAAYPDTPDDDLRTPLLTYHYRQEPGRFGQNAERKPRHAGDASVLRPDGQAAVVSLFRQRFEYRITFEVWERNGVLADALALELRRYFSELVPYFQKLGASEFLFVLLDGSRPERQWKTDLVRRELVYQLVMDEITNVTSPAMLAFSVEGFVYRSLYHMIDENGTALPVSLVASPASILTAETTSLAAGPDAGNDPVVITLN